MKNTIILIALISLASSVFAQKDIKSSGKQSFSISSNKEEDNKKKTEKEEKGSGTKTFDLEKKEDKFNSPTIDQIGPEIVMLEPADISSIQSVEGKKLLVKGKATDESGVFEVTINGLDATISEDGTFSLEAPLAIGNNSIKIIATDIKLNSTALNFNVIRKTATTATTVVTNSYDFISSAKYYAVIIAVQDYLDDNITDLEEPIRDAKRVAAILKEQYTFEEENLILLENPTKADIIGTFHGLRSRINEADNLLIFYAGHGYWDEGMKIGYWLPSDAEKDNPVNWLPNTDLTNYLNAINSKHTLLIADACFSGGIFKTRGAFNKTNFSAYDQIYRMNSRKAMTSGTLNEVPDKSVFIEYMLKRLKENKQKYLSSEQLFVSMKMAVINNSPNVPQYGTIQNTGDEGGEFIFVKRSQP
jgi:hypothetical protein